jgi:excisionase family DNA binding protein
MMSALPLAGDALRSCPNCGKLVGPKHAYRSGKTRCRNRYTWTPLRLLALEEMIHKGHTDEVIARRLGVTANAVRIVRTRRRLPTRTVVCGSARSVARRLGIGCAKSVTAWIDRGYLRGRPGQVRGKHPQRYVDEADLRDFLRDPAHWHRWEVERIVDPALRALATTVRGEVRFLTQAEVADRCFVQRATVQQWIDKGWLPAVSTGSHRVVRASDLAAFRPPTLGFDRERFDRMRAEGTIARPLCQGQPRRGNTCCLTARHEVAGVRLCNRHHQVLVRRGGVRVRRTADGPIEAIVDMPDGYRIYPA